MSSARVSEQGAGAVGLLAVLLSGLPRLDGATCVGSPGIFREAESGNRVRVAQCIAACRRCPCLQLCRELCEGMSYSQKRDRTGVWAGHYCGRGCETENETTGTDNE